MRITGKQLRQIIKEELTRSMSVNEADMFTQADLDAEFDADIERRTSKMRRVDPLAGFDPDADTSSVVKMPSAPEPSGALASGAAKIPALRVIESEMPEVLSEIKALISDPKVRKVLNDVHTGKTILSVGDSGPAVKVYQAVVMSNLMMWGKAHRSLGRGDLAGFAEDPVAIAEKSIKTDGNITGAELLGAVQLLTTIGGFTPDGSYGPKTRAAVALLQTIMDRKQIISIAAGGSVNWDAAIDGIIGRQTAQFLAGFTKLAAITGVELKESRRRSRF